MSTLNSNRIMGPEELDRKIIIQCLIQSRKMAENDTKAYRLLDALTVGMEERGETKK